MSIFLTRTENNCKRYPNRIAFTDEKDQMTYAELWEASGKVASWLIKNGMGKDDFCQLVLPRSTASMASLLGALRAGCAFCNLDSKYPAERILFIRADLGAKCVIDEETYRHIQKEEDAIEGWVEADPHDAAFAVYTSGSTGRPKGVLHEFGNVDICLSLYPEQEEYEEMHACLTAPFYSVASVLLAINCMAVARTTHIVSELLLRDVRGMNKFLVENKIRDTFLPPSYIRIYHDPSPYLEEILTGAERADDIYYESGKPKILNYYSMSEAGFPLLIWPIDRKYDHTPVGMPVVPGIDLHLVDKDGNRIEGAGEGEICFKNPYVRGYVNLPDKTAESFRNGYFYTGDTARRDEHGIYYIVGRVDDMFNVSGNRVEPGEVEVAFKRVTGIKVCCAKGFDEAGSTFICMFYEGELESDADEIRAALSESLPDYMIPNMFVKVDEMPRMAHGKIDRKVLTDPRVTSEMPPYEAPADEIEETLCRVIGKVLEVDDIGVNDEFLALGGSSLAAMKVVVESGLEGFSAIDLYKGKTIRDTAKLYRERAASLDGLTDEEREDMERSKVQELTLPQDVVIRRQECYPDSTNHLYPFLVSVSKLVSAKRMCKAIHTIMKHHAVFGTVFGKDENGRYIQRYDPDSIRLPEIEKMSRDELDTILNGPFEPFDLFNEPLVRVRIIKARTSLYALFVYHHLIFDGSSMQLIGQNFMNAYLGKELETDTYFSYVADETKLYGTEAMKRAKQYYADNYDGIDWCWDVPHDIDEPGLLPAQRPIPTQMTPDRLAAMEKRTGVTRGVMCGAALLMTLAELSGNNNALISSFFHGRTDSLRKRAAGLVSSHIAVGVDFTKVKTLADLYDEIQRKTSEGIANSLYDWCAVNSRPYVSEPIDLVYDTPEITNMGLMSTLGVKVTDLDPHWDKNMKLSYLMVFETPKDINVVLMYTKSIMSDAMIDRFAELFSKYANRMLEIEAPAKTPIKDITA